MVFGSGICAKRVVVDARHHMLGRFASIIAKEFLNGQKMVAFVILLRSSGGQFVVPLFYRMIPHKTKREAAAHACLKAYERVPPPYDKIKRMVIPDALKVLRLQAGHKHCLLGKLSSKVEWNHYDTIKELEKKRKERAQLAYERKKQLNKLRVKAESVAEEKLGRHLEVIAPIKY